MSHSVDIAVPVPIRWTPEEVAEVVKDIPRQVIERSLLALDQLDGGNRRAVELCRILKAPLTAGAAT